ncbi:MAG TPA: RluA family pseudouridine synthase [bacterium]|nr:RluA family pseudouridine synthase [bacterium]
MKEAFPSGQPEVTLTSYISQKSSQTLLEYLCRRFTYLNEDQWKERIASGKVKVNDRPASPGQPLRAGDEVAYSTSAWEEPAVNADYRILYADEALLAVAKPAPLPVHAIGAYFNNTLMSLLRRDIPEAENYHLAHRLDSETSGVLLLAKDKAVLKKLIWQWENDKVRKTYRAIVFGIFPERKTQMDAPILDQKGGPIRMKGGVDFAKGKPSITNFKRLGIRPLDEIPLAWREKIQARGGLSLIEARPLTGRTHQIRVHLEFLGFPIVGDKLYSGDDETFLHFYEHDFDEWVRSRVLLPRMALHAYELEIAHPATGEPLVLRSPFAPDLQAFWDGLSQ